jgi:hypothetical protein
MLNFSHGDGPKDILDDQPVSPKCLVSRKLNRTVQDVVQVWRLDGHGPNESQASEALEDRSKPSHATIIPVFVRNRFWAFRPLAALLFNQAA